jgi:excinuclease UvrABC ATPase subunit
MARLLGWQASECDTCAGNGTVLPSSPERFDDDCELELCSVCHGYGYIAEKLEQGSFWEGFVDVMLAAELTKRGELFRTKRECQEVIENSY